MFSEDKTEKRKAKAKTPARLPPAGGGKQTPARKEGQQQPPVTPNEGDKPSEGEGPIAATPEAGAQQLDSSGRSQPETTPSSRGQLSTPGAGKESIKETKVDEEVSFLGVVNQPKSDCPLENVTTPPSSSSISKATSSNTTKVRRDLTFCFKLDILNNILHIVNLSY